MPPMEPKQCCGSLGHRHKKNCPTQVSSGTGEPKSLDEATGSEVLSSVPAKPEATTKDTVMADLMKEVAALKAKDEENQKTLKMLTEVADKGRVFSYEQRQQTDKKPQKVKLSKVGNSIVVGWRTVRDELIQDPRTGRTIGENQEYELLLLDPEGKTTPSRVQGYLNFSNVRYENRISANVVGKSEDYSGNTTLKLELEDGRVLDLDSKFVN